MPAPFLHFFLRILSSPTHTHSPLHTPLIVSILCLHSFPSFQIPLPLALRPDTLSVRVQPLTPFSPQRRSLTALSQRRDSGLGDAFPSRRRCLDLFPSLACV